MKAYNEKFVKEGLTFDDVLFDSGGERCYTRYG